MVRVKGGRELSVQRVSFKESGKGEVDKNVRKEEGEPEMLLIELRLRFLAALIVLH